MARLIDADALEKFPIRIDHYDKEHGNEDFVLGIETVLEYAEHLPTVDAVPVVHGRWIEHPKVEKVNGKWISNYECSECCCFYRSHENYCGHCGSKMDLEVE